MPGLKISEADRQRIKPKFICSKCDLLLREPMQTPCGHLMCQSCVENMLSNLANPTCSVDGTPLVRERAFFSDKCIRGELMKLTLDCPNEGCDRSEMIYEIFQEHVPRCVEARERNGPNPREDETLDPQENDENE